MLQDSSTTHVSETLISVQSSTLVGRTLPCPMPSASKQEVLLPSLPVLVVSYAEQYVLVLQSFVL